MSPELTDAYSPEDIAWLRELLTALVVIPSVNPPGDETAVASLLEGRLQAAGFETRIAGIEPHRPNLVAHRRGSGGGPTLLLNGHMDVQPSGTRWTRDPFAAQVEGTTLYGQGSMDMKAGLTAMLFAVELLDRDEVRLKGDLTITAVADEVCGGHLGTGYLVKEGLIQADMAVVGEPTGAAVRVAHRGALWMQIEVTGRSAHGGRPWLGVNAISKITRIINAIEGELLPSLASRTHPLLPAPTINLGTVTGGTKFNLVADRAVLEIDRRMVPGETAEQALGEVAALCQEIRDADDETWEVAVTPVMHVTPGEIAPDAPIVKACQAAHLAVTGEVASIAATAGFEDAHFLLDAGIPTAMFGPYRPVATATPGVADSGAGPASSTQPDRFFTNSGMADECVDLVDVARAGRVYARLITDLLT